MAQVVAPTVAPRCHRLRSSEVGALGHKSRMLHPLEAALPGFGAPKLDDALHDTELPDMTLRTSLPAAFGPKLELQGVCRCGHDPASESLHREEVQRFQMDLSQMMQLQLQMEMDKKSQFENMLSDSMKTAERTSDGI